MAQSPSIRPALRSDFGDLQSLFQEIDRLHLEGAPWLLKQADEDPRPPGELEILIESEKSEIFVACADKCIGLAIVHLREAPNFPVFIQQEHAVIDLLIVDSSWQRKGVGLALYQACESWATQLHAQWLEVNVYDFNSEAYDFYTAANFTTSMRKMRKPLNPRH